MHAAVLVGWPSLTTGSCSCGLACRLAPCRRRPQVMTEVVMDTLRALSSPSLDIRKKTLDISLDLITARNIDEVGSRELLRGRARRFVLGLAL